MNNHTLTTPATLTTLVVAAGLVVSGCAAQPAASIEPQTLTLYHVDGAPQLDVPVSWFIDAVAERSGGALTIEVTQSCCGSDPNVEKTLVNAVAAGDADLGWVGTRVFADLGVDSLRALTAPLLIDGYGLQQAALESDAAQIALDAVSALDVTPLALVPGSIRYPLGAEAAVTSLDDWAGLAIAAFHSAQNADALSALGADPVDVGFTERDEGIYDGTIGALENSLVMQDRDREQTLPYATVDVGLWPRSSALIADPASDAAKPGIADILKRAAADVVARTADLGDLDAVAMTTSCADGARFALAGADQVTAMREAVQPVLDDIAADPDAAPLLETIIGLADNHKTAVPEIPDGCDGEAPSLVEAPGETGEPGAPGDAAVLNGSFQTADYTEEQLLEAGLPPDEAHNASAQFTLMFTDGAFRLIARDDGMEFGCAGPYTVTGNRVVVNYLPGGDCGKGGVLFAADFVVDEDTLTLTNFSGAVKTDEWLFGNAPLTRVD